ncbi:MAG: hypothetical protein AAFV59_16385 [Pseudomonadota bacterium]
MLEFDNFEGKKIVERSREFTRQNLESWILRGNELGDDKFRFVDRFVRTLAISGELHEVAEVLLDQRLDKESHVIEDMFQTRSPVFKKLAEGLLSRMVGRGFVHPVELTTFVHPGYSKDFSPHQKFNNCILLFSKMRGAVLSCDILYLFGDVNTAGFSTLSNISISSKGFIIPQKSAGKDSMAGLFVSYSEQFKGSSENAYVSTGASFSYMAFDDKGEGASRLFMSWAPHILMPFSLFSWDDITDIANTNRDVKNWQRQALEGWSEIPKAQLDNYSLIEKLSDLSKAYLL